MINKACEFCNLDVSFHEFAEHQLVCGSRTDICSNCNQRVLLSKMNNHSCTRNNNNNNKNKDNNNMHYNDYINQRNESNIVFTVSDDIPKDEKLLTSMQYQLSQLRHAVSPMLYKNKNAMKSLNMNQIKG